MKKIIAGLFLVLTTTTTFAWTQVPPNSVEACRPQSPYGFAQTQKQVVAICRHAYVTAFDPVAKIPVWVAYTLQPANALGCVPRSNAFATDKSQSASATPQDYDGTGYDKGHNAPDGDMSFDTQAEFESFLMTNMSPQAPSLNRGTWKLLETSVRGWAVQLNHPLTVYAGNIYGPDDKTIGNGVVVPHALFKIVIDNTTGQVAGWVFPHVAPYPNLGTDLKKYRVPVTQIEQLTGVTFAFPSNAQELPANQEWFVDFGKLTAAKKQKCGANIDVN